MNKGKNMTVERYIRIFAGLFIMVSLALGLEGSPVFVSPWALAFTAFVGVNLFQFGFTNFCPMSIILRKLGVPDVACGVNTSDDPAQANA
jgi:hypothetical protein